MFPVDHWLVNPGIS